MSSIDWASRPAPFSLDSSVTDRHRVSSRGTKSSGPKSTKPVAAEAAAEAEKVRALAAAERYQVDAEGARQINKAENVLSQDSRAGRLKEKLLERIEGIVRESVKPL